MIEVSLLNSWSRIVAIDTLIFASFVLSTIWVFKRKSSCKSVRFASVIYTFSYGLSWQLSELVREGDTYFALDAYYLNWLVYDAFTVFSVFAIHHITKTVHDSSVKFAYSLSALNMLSYLAMHYLAFIERHSSHWFYPIYSNLVNITAMIIVVSFAFSFKIFRKHTCQSSYR
ncbi:hypothetical protein [Pseudoalteromonas xiamenensis]